MVYNRTITRFIADDNVVYQWVRWEIRLASDNSWARHHLKHVSWRSRWIIYVHTWTENGSFMWNLTSWPIPFWLVLLTEHKVFHYYTTNTVYTAAWLWDNCTRLVASVQKTVDASKFPTFVRQFTQQPSCTILLWQIEIFNQNHIFLWNFYDFV